MIKGVEGSLRKEHNVIKGLECLLKGFRFVGCAVNECLIGFDCRGVLNVVERMCG